MPDAVLEVCLEHLLIMKKDELRMNSPVSRLYTTLPPENKSVDSNFQYQLGGAVQATIPEFPSSRNCSRNSKDPLADDARSFRVVAVNRMQQSNE